MGNHSWANTHKQQGKTSKSYSPPPGLVDALCDEVGGKGIFELPAVFEGVVHLCVGHAPTLEPAVEHFRYPAQVTLPTARWDGQVVDAASRKMERKKNWPRFTLGIL